MSDLLSQLLAEKDYLIADGATGTNMMLIGLGPGDAPDLWNVDFPDRVADLHRRFVEAGADILLTNTFGSNPMRLSLDEIQGRTGEINGAGVRLARAAADAVGRPVVVAGSMGPTGELVEPLGPVTVDEVEASYTEQAAVLADAGVDVLWIETVFHFDEMAAAYRGAVKTGLPIVATMTFDTHRRTMMGDTPEKAIEFTHTLPTPLVAFGANCGAGQSMLIDTIRGLARGANDGEVIVAKGNCGVPKIEDDMVVFDGTLESIAIYGRLARDAGARIIGGCCGTTPEHLKALVDALDGYVPGETPDDATIEAALGPIDPPKRR